MPGRLFPLLCSPVLLIALLSAPIWAEARTPLSGARQLLLVTTADWDADRGELARFERGSASQAWKRVGEILPVTLGKYGLAWGRGLHGFSPGSGPVKVEGDKKSPAGVFSLPLAFASQPERLGFPLRIPCHRVTEDTICVETSDSRRYNTILDEGNVPDPDWSKPDRMLRKDGRYRYGLFVGHNTDPPVPTGGSCIFLHLWRGPGAWTIGCTAMSNGSMRTILRWIDAEKHPVIVQLPRPVYADYAETWRLPPIP